MPTKRSRTSLINRITPNIVRTHSNWNEISNKLRQVFENFRTTYNNDIAKLASQLIRKRGNPSDHDIKKFISGSVWERPLKKHIDALDYDIFKNRQSEAKSLENFIAASLKIHVEFLIAESKGEDPDYNSMVLNRIKELDNITINFQFSAASHLQYANQLELKEERGRLKK
ncbi:15123_t:CDS:2 [Racocetra fulgida]|uniref:15123_t:CDS:1 n=1 Tax=Racocetra fulgida TaxID=60492 RepID=A0A9N9AKI5_9GLOM|nr:15123_t:CDS:2 [Racocetra fulgida]